MPQTAPKLPAEDFRGTAPLRKLVVLLVPHPLMASPCWEVLGARRQSLNRHAYAHVNLRSRRVPAHRWMWSQHHGEIPAGMVVHHQCFHKLCINPDHLALATFGDNSRLSNFGLRRARAVMRRAEHNGEAA